LEKAPLYWAEDIVKVELVQEDLSGQWVSIQVADQPVVQTFMDLSGGYQIENLRTCISVIYQLDLLHGEKSSIVSDVDAFAQIREKTGMLGRWQVLSESPPIILDGAHNISALEAVFKSFFAIDAERYHIVIGVSNDKDISNLLSHLPRFPKYFFCQADVPRALHYRKYIDIAIEEYGLNATGYDTVELAYKAALKRTSPFDALLVCGSIFVVGELLARMKT
jgi:dihydrofolate synthase/folylpolyglutamate synthase